MQALLLEIKGPNKALLERAQANPKDVDIIDVDSEQGRYIEIVCFHPVPLLFFSALAKDHIELASRTWVWESANTAQTNQK